MMIWPTSATIRSWSKVAFDDLGYQEDSDLDVIVGRAAAYIEWATGRTAALMPTELEKLAEECIQLLVEVMAAQRQEDVALLQANYATIASFSAGAYSETRRGMDEVRKSGLIHADPRIHQMLWALLTDEKRDEWISWLTGEDAPAESTTEVDWNLSYFDYYEPEPRGSR